MGPPSWLIFLSVGSSSLIQSILSTFFAIFGVLIFKCYAKFPMAVDANHRTNYLHYLTYFKGKCDLHPGGSKGDWPEETDAARRTFYFLLIYGVTNSVWMLTSAFLLVAGVRRLRGYQGGAKLCYLWLINTAILIVLDLSGGIWYGVDISRTQTPSDYRKFVGNAAGPLPVRLDDVTYLPAFFMTMIFLRGVVLLVTNVIACVVVDRAVGAVEAILKSLTQIDRSCLNAIDPRKIVRTGSLQSLNLSTRTAFGVQSQMGYRKYSLGLADEWLEIETSKTPGHQRHEAVTNLVVQSELRSSTVLDRGDSPKPLLNGVQQSTTSTAAAHQQQSPVGSFSAYAENRHSSPQWTNQQLDSSSPWHQADLLLQQRLRQQNADRLRGCLLQQASLRQQSIAQLRKDYFKYRPTADLQQPATAGAAPISRRPSPCQLIRSASDKLKSLSKVEVENQDTPRTTLSNNSQSKSKGRSSFPISSSDNKDHDLSAIDEQQRRQAQLWMIVDGKLRPADYCSHLRTRVQDVCPSPRKPKKPSNDAKNANLGEQGQSDQDQRPKHRRSWTAGDRCTCGIDQKCQVHARSPVRSLVFQDFEMPKQSRNAGVQAKPSPQAGKQQQLKQTQQMSSAASNKPSVCDQKRNHYRNVIEELVSTMKLKASNGAGDCSVDDQTRCSVHCREPRKRKLSRTISSIHESIQKHAEDLRYMQDQAKRRRRHSSDSSKLRKRTLKKNFIKALKELQAETPRRPFKSTTNRPKSFSTSTPNSSPQSRNPAIARSTPTPDYTPPGSPKKSNGSSYPNSFSSRNSSSSSDLDSSTKSEASKTSLNQSSELLSPFPGTPRYKFANGIPPSLAIPEISQIIAASASSANSSSTSETTYHTAASTDLASTPERSCSPE